jgi:hypothetical protein
MFRNLLFEEVFHDKILLPALVFQRPPKENENRF